MIADDIKRLMEFRGVNQSQLADRLGVSRACVCKWFRVECNPTVKTLGRIAEVLGGELEIKMRPK